MLRAIPTHICARRFSIRDGDQEVAELSIGWFSETGTATAEGRAMQLRREHVAGGAFELEVGGTLIAKAYKPSLFRNRFELDFGNVRIILERESLLGFAFVIRRGRDVLGRIERPNVFTREAEIDLPDEWPIPLKLFVIWLVLIIWRRLNSA